MSIQDELAAINEKFVAAFANQDLDSVMDAFSEDAVFLVPGRRLISGRPAIERIFRGMTASEPIAFRWETVQMFESGDLVVEVAREWFRGAGDETEAPWKYVAVYRRENGVLKVLVDAAMPEVEGTG
jgi:uncharacterized protein (TIGR02246 family)